MTRQHLGVHRRPIQDHRPKDGAPVSERAPAKVTGAHLVRTAYL